MYGYNILAPGLAAAASAGLGAAHPGAGHRPTRRVGPARPRAPAPADDRRPRPRRSRPHPSRSAGRGRAAPLARLRRAMSRALARAASDAVTYGNEPDLSVDAFIDVLRRSTLA